MKTRPRTLFTMLTVFGATALGLHFGALEALGIVPSPPVTYALGDLNGQNGWDGGIVGGNPIPFTNNNSDSNVVTNTRPGPLGTRRGVTAEATTAPARRHTLHAGCGHSRRTERDRRRQPHHPCRQQVGGFVRLQGGRAG